MFQAMFHAAGWAGAGVEAAGAAKLSRGWKDAGGDAMAKFDITLMFSDASVEGGSAGIWESY